MDVVGLLTKAGLPFLAEIFKDYENRYNEKYRPANPNIPVSDKPSAADPIYAIEMEDVSLYRTLPNSWLTTAGWVHKT